MAAALVLGAAFATSLALAGAGLGGLGLPAPGVPRLSPRLALALGAGLVALLVTGWPVAGLAGAALAAQLPGVLAGRGARRAEVARAEAVAAWTEMLRDTRAVGVGLGQAIAATAPVAPAPIAAAVAELADRCRREPPEAALAGFASAVGDRTADLVVAALIQSQRRAGSLEGVLSALARLGREEAAMRDRLEAARAGVDTAVRIVSGLTVTLVAGLVVLNRGFLAPYDSALGQLVLAVIAAAYAGSFVWLARLRRVELPERILAPGGRP